MRKLWVVAKHEYLKITRKRSFLFGTLAMPLVLCRDHGASRSWSWWRVKINTRSATSIKPAC